MPGRMWMIITVELCLFGVLLFASAGDFAWPDAWVFLILFAASAYPMAIVLSRHDPDMMKERGRSPIQPDQPHWDKIAIIVLLVLFLLLFVAAGFDRRFGWSQIPFALKVGAGITMLVAFWLTYRVMRFNSYLVTVVRIQHERDQTVVTTGPYAIVRHPFYATVGLAVAAIAVLLGSLWSLAIAGLIVLTFALRCVREEHHLAAGLKGYTDYMEAVRFRLVPGVW